MFDSLVSKFPWRRKWQPALVFLGFPCGSAGKISTCNAGDLGSPSPQYVRCDTLDPLPTDTFLISTKLPTRHGERSPVGYSPWGRKRVRHNLATERQATTIGNSQSAPLPPPPRWQPQDRSVCGSVYGSWMSSFRSSFRFHTEAASYICLTFFTWSGNL